MTDANNKNSLSSSNLNSDQGRKKIILGKGFSLMDWVRLTKTAPDLAGNQGVLKRITHEELALHNKEDDCWLAIYDKVYNVTPYMKFHPGGIEELMKGAGINATNLFNEVHPWVNLQSMLEKCLVGHLVGIPIEITSKKTDVLKASLSTDAIKKLSLNKNSNHANDDKVQVRDITNIPSLDFYQSNDSVTVVLYTKWKNMKSEYVIVEKTDTYYENDSKKISNSNNSLNKQPAECVFLFVYIQKEVYKYTIEMVASVENDYQIKVTKEGKIEIGFRKIEKAHWQQMSPNLKFKSESVFNSQSGINYRICELARKVNVNHDTDLYYLNLPITTRMCVPIGFHVFLKFINEEILTKPYTVIDDSLLNSSNEMQLKGKQICLMIKHYEDGAFTSELKKLPIGSKLEISNFTGSFEIERLNDCDELILICAGSGFTPMIRLLKKSLEIDSIINLNMLFFNKTVNDILWKNELEQLKEKYSKKIKITHILSNANPEWKGKTGRIRKDLIDELIIKSFKKPLFCVCGPRPFCDITLNLINEMGYTEENIQMFLG